MPEYPELEAASRPWDDMSGLMAEITALIPEEIAAFWPVYDDVPRDVDCVCEGIDCHCAWWLRATMHLQRAFEEKGFIRQPPRDALLRLVAVTVAWLLVTDRNAVDPAEFAANVGRILSEGIPPVLVDIGGGDDDAVPDADGKDGWKVRGCGCPLGPGAGGAEAEVTLCGCRVRRPLTVPE